LVFPQLRCGNEQLYWKSIEDILTFIRITADARASISSGVLCGFFAKAKPAMVGISDFENLGIPFGAMLASFARHQLEMARCPAVEYREHRTH
jgi:hypothetical protein